MDGATLSSLAGTDITLNLVDFIILDDGNLYVHNNDGTTYILEFYSGGQWILWETIPTTAVEGETSFAFTINFLLDQYGDYTRQQGVAFNNRIVV